MEKRFAEYPKLNDLIDKKNQVAAETHCPPTYLHADLRNDPISNFLKYRKINKFYLYI